ncbi:MAG: formimidoylglutamate deiminase [Flavobacteriales bacterium]|jgi:formimidoylglutamate deiminase|nr:formimidoylglutamate deiminase [Flavobacteriales bacterium]
MKIYKLKGLLQNEGWISPAFVTVSKKGKIKSISDTYNDGHPIINLNGYAIPGFQNAHSHAFQYAMAGLAEKHQISAHADDFWSWREAMYDLALQVTPEQLEHIAVMLYSEMVRHGYTHVAEFHYLHHDIDGQPYPDQAEMGKRLIKAAKRAGINITLIPIFYQMGGFGVPPTSKQKRFLSKTTAQYIALLNASMEACSIYKGATIGIGIHSLRGVKGEDIIKISKHEAFKTLPFHIHIAEQLKEIEDSINFQNKRPVEWLLENIELNERFQLVHATHLTPDEVKGIAETKANVVLCPTTEGNLGDGIFPLIEFQKLNGKWSIGTDSHVSLNPLEELRLLDYGQRLVSHRRNIFTSSTEGNSANYAIQQSLITGRKAMGNFNEEYFKIGDYFNAAVFNADFPLIANSSLENLTNTILYATDSIAQLGTITNGKLICYKGKHKKADRIAQNFQDSITTIGNR